MNNSVEILTTAELLSALSDGEGDPAAVWALTARWRDDAELRIRWHGYQLIGDAMRSDELAGSGRDADFLKRLRTRLDLEPVVLAPVRAPDRAPARPFSATGRTRRWAGPAAMAAGFVMVAGAVLVTRSPGPMPSVDLARAPTTLPVTTAGSASVTAPLTTVVATSSNAASTRAAEVAVPFQGVLLRDARMQQYFAAHQQFGGSTALGVPSAFLRSATFETPAVEAGSR